MSESSPMRASAGVVKNSDYHLVTTISKESTPLINRRWPWYKWGILVLLILSLISGVVIPLVNLLRPSKYSNGITPLESPKGEEPIVKVESSVLASKPDLTVLEGDFDIKLLDTQANSYSLKLSEPFPYHQKKIRGVNLGGWLVPEPFIVPSLFEPYIQSHNVTDEWTLCEAVGKEKCSKLLSKHYDSFLTEREVKQLADAGLNHVRVPFGYWSIDTNPNEPFIYGAWEYLLRGIRWCRKYGLRVMIDFHSAPGSQNGWNHSGRAGEIHFLNKTEPTSSSENVERFTEIVKNVTTYFSQPEFRNVVTQIGVLNEPNVIKTQNFEGTLEFYRNISSQLNEITSKSDYHPLLVFNEGFIGLDKWGNTQLDKNYSHVAMDVHNYLIFSSDLASLTRDQFKEIPCQTWAKDMDKSNRDFGMTMCGEFSVAINDCALYLNGIGVGARYDGTYLGSQPACSNCTCDNVNNYRLFSSSDKSFMLTFVERQMDAFERGIGWFFWNFKTENGVNPHWDYLLGLREGWIPRNAGHRASQCH